MSRYAENTSVPVERSRTEIERTLARYGAEKFGYVTERGAASIAFQVNGRGVRMRLPLPDPESFQRTGRGRRLRGTEAMRREWEGAVRQRWRALALVVKAKLEAIEAGIATFDDEWLAYLVLPGGETVGEKLQPQLSSAQMNGGPLRLGLDGAP